MHGPGGALSLQRQDQEQCSAVQWCRAVVRFHKGMCSVPEQGHRHQAPLTQYTHTVWVPLCRHFLHTYVPTHRNSAHSKSDAAWNGRPVHIEPKLFHYKKIYAAEQPRNLQCTQSLPRAVFLGLTKIRMNQILSTWVISNQKMHMWRNFFIYVVEYA